MNDDNRQENIAELNDRSFTTLLRSIDRLQGEFALILVRCNYASLRTRTIARLIAQNPAIQTLTLPESTRSLYTEIHRHLPPSPIPHPPSPPAALFILGLENLTSLDQALVSTNSIRDEFRNQFPFPLVVWVNDWVLQKLTRLAPDFKSWSGGAVIDFEMAIADLLDSLRDHTSRLFAAILETGDERFPPNWMLTPPANSLRRTEVEFALNRLAASNTLLDPPLQASVDFLLGQEAHTQSELSVAQEYYESSLKFWLSRSQGNTQKSESTESPTPPPTPPPTLPSYPPQSLCPHPSPYTERAACVLVYLGLLHRAYAVLQRVAYRAECARAMGYFERSLNLFEQINRQDLVAKFIIPQAEVLQKLGAWDELEVVARKALVLHKLYRDPVRQARDHGFLAEVAIARTYWTKAETQLEFALDILRQAEDAIAAHDHPHPHLEVSLEIAHRYHYGWYRLMQARVKLNLGQTEQAIANLEDARDHTYPHNDPTLYIQILETLRNAYFDEKRYREAFRTRQLQRSLEQQFGFRAFVGALRLEAQQYLLNALPNGITTESLLAQEIAASGRQQDVERLIARLGRSDVKLTVIHGPSGVGKSSIVTAGLVPALKDRPIGERVALAIVIDRYNDWQATVEEQLAGLEGSGGVGEWESERGNVEGSDIQPESSNIQPQSSIVQPQSSDIQPQSSDIQPQSSIIQPQSSDIQPQSSDIQPQSSDIQPQSSDIQPQSSNIQPQSSDIQPQSSDIQPQSSIIQPDGSNMEPDNTNLQTPGEIAQPSSPIPHPPSLLPILHHATTQSLLPVLIFDQFEEFFFTYDTVPKRRPFYEFLRDCLYQDYVKVILVLREDYLHYLLEFQKFARVEGTNLDSIADILGREVRYPLDDFTPEEARSVIQNLTARAQFYMEPALVDALVADLAGELGTIRPIELQVVGAQMQKERIDTLAEYREKGPKEKLVARSLESVVQDCGPENEDIARLVLFLLTNENETRPFKTRDDLEADLVDLGMTHEIDKLDLVMEVVVGSGLVFEIPEKPDTLYQLVHDYLVKFIRQQYKTGLVEELEREREQRKIAEEKLSVELKYRLATEQKLATELQQRLTIEQERNQVVRQRLHWSRIAGVVLASSAVLAGILWW